jgi:RNA polymerase sigma-70 factor, ECF subfamily
MTATDAELIARSRGGNREAFGELVARYQDFAYGLGYHLAGNFEDARDLAQEAFIHAYLKLEQLRDAKCFSGWLRRIVENTHRNRQRTPRVVTVPLEDGEAEMRAEHPAEIEVVVQEALQKLKEPERLALTLQYINGYSQAEIGQFLGVRPETVKTRIARARQHLKEEMMAMVEETFEKKKLPEEFTQETMTAAVNRAEEHMRKGRVGAALEEYESALKQDADFVPALLGLGVAQKMIGQEAEALEHFRRVVKLDRGNDQAQEEIEHILGGRLNRIEELIALEEEMLKTHPENANLHVDLASNYIGQQRYTEAEAHLHKALEIEPEGLRPRIYQGDLLARQGRYEEAIEVLVKFGPVLNEQVPYKIAYEWNRLELAMVQCAAGKYNTAIDTVREILLLPEDSRVDRLVERSLQVAERCYHLTDRITAFAGFCRGVRKQMQNRNKLDRLAWYLALFLESRLMAKQAEDEFTSLGAIPARCWRVVVPFDNKDGRGMAAVYPPEQQVNLNDTDVGKDGRHLRWLRPVVDGAGYELNLMKQIQVNPFFFENGLGYAVLKIISPVKREVRFRFGAGGWSQIWLNGDSIFLGRTCVGVPDYESVPLHLKRGKNELLVKIGVQKSLPPLRGEYYYWSLFSRITDAAGEPLRDLQFPLEKEKKEKISPQRRKGR